MTKRECGGYCSSTSWKIALLTNSAASMFLAEKFCALEGEICCKNAILELDVDGRIEIGNLWWLWCRSKSLVIRIFCAKWNPRTEKGYVGGGLSFAINAICIKHTFYYLVQYIYFDAKHPISWICRKLRYSASTSTDAHFMVLFKVMPWWLFLYERNPRTEKGYVGEGHSDASTVTSVLQ